MANNVNNIMNLTNHERRNNITNGNNKNINTNNEQNSTTKDRLVKSTFYITYAFLVTTGTITFIEALRNENPMVRHVLNLETVISIIAGFFYMKFMEKIKDNKKIDYRDINLNRYLDWAITTPVMLLVLCLVLGINTKQTISAGYVLVIFLLNYLMLGSGYLGEIKLLDRKVGLLLGWVFFIVLYGLIYMTFIHGRNVFDNNMIYWAFVVFWAFYGVFYNLDEEKKNVGYNILDLFSKCFVGIFFWAYLTKVIKIF